MTWSTPAIQRGPVLYSGTITAPANSTGLPPSGGSPVVYGPWDATSFAGLFVSLYGGIGGGTLSIQTSQDASFATGLIQNQWTVRQEANMRVVVPLLGNFVRAVLTTPATLAYTGTLTLQPVNSVGGLLYPGPTQGVNATSVSTTAGTHTRYWLPWVSPGLASFFFNSSPEGVYWVQLFASNPLADLNTSTTIYGGYLASTPLTSTVVLPPGPVWVDVWDKSTTGTNAYSFGLTPGGVG